MPRDIWNTAIASRPQLIPLPIPVIGQIPVKYQTYDKIKGLRAETGHLPSLKPRTAPSAEAVAEDKEVAKAVPAFVAERNKTAKFWTANNVRHVLKCQKCDKPRCIYAWPLALEDFGDRLHHLHDIIEQSFYEYFCGDPLLGLDDDQVPHHPLLKDCFYIRRALVCGMDVETNYYSSPKKFESICFHCGSPDDLVDNETLQQTTKGKKALPTCGACFKIPGFNVKTTGRASHTGSPGFHKRGDDLIDAPATFAKKKKVKATASDLTKHFPKKPKLKEERVAPPPSRTNGEQRIAHAPPLFHPLSLVPFNSSPYSLPDLSVIRNTFGDHAYDLFDFIDPKPDGNCGYYVVQWFNEITG